MEEEREGGNLWLGLADGQAVGVTAGASAPDVLVQQVVDQLQSWGGKHAREAEGIPEHVVFALPKELRNRKPGEA